MYILIQIISELNSKSLIRIDFIREELDEKKLSRPVL